MAVTIKANLKTRELAGKMNDPAVWLYAANEWHRLYRQYVPYKEGMLYNSVTYNCEQGKATVTHTVPYAHYLYEGVVYEPSVPIMQGATVTGYFTPVDKKTSSGRSLTYSTLYSGKATKHWDEAAKATQMPLLEKSVKAYIEGRL